MDFIDLMKIENERGAGFMKKDLLTEDEVIRAVINYLNTKGHTEVRRVLHRSDASKKEHGVDLQVKLPNSKGNGNNYFIEAKGLVKSFKNQAVKII